MERAREAVRLSTAQERNNHDAREAWGPARAHRLKLTAELLRCARGDTGSLCVLGAGNCNDLDLDRLSSRFDAIHLVDLDEAALRFGHDRQPPSVRSRLHLHPGVEITGTWDLLSGLVGSEFDRGIDRLLARLDDRGPQIDGPFDVVASTCLLSQLVDAAVTVLGARHPRLIEVVRAIRRQHWRQLVELTGRGGEGLLVTDFVSSETLPELTTTTVEGLPALVEQAIRQRNFFSGLNPFDVIGRLRGDAELAARLAGTSLLRPWLWNHGARVYAVYAIRFRRRG